MLFLTPLDVTERAGIYIIKIIIIKFHTVFLGNYYYLNNIFRKTPTKPDSNTPIESV